LILGPDFGQTNGWKPSAFVFIAFKQQVLGRLNELKTTLYLRDLNNELNAFLTGSNPSANLWDITLKHYKTPLAAARIIATLFQDTSPQMLHIGFLQLSQAQGQQHFEGNKELLARVIGTMNLFLEYNRDDFREFFYPRGGNREFFNRNIYHYYVPMYLAMQLKEEGWSFNTAYTSPFMLTLSYEFVTSSSDYRYVLKDPERIDPVKQLGTLKDIFAAHAGVNFGLNQAVSKSFFHTMKTSFGRSTKEGVSLLLRRW
jgi:hypothetical protein